MLLAMAVPNLYGQPAELLQPGTVAPLCNLEATDGQRYSFPASGSWSLVAYWSLFCHSCLDEIPEVQRRLASESPEIKPFFIALDSKKMEKALKNFCKRRQLSFLVLYEEIASDSYVTADQMGVSMTPSIFIVDPEGKIAYSHAGPMDIDKFFSEFAEMRQKVKTSANCDE